MSHILDYTVIDGIKCYSPNVLGSYTDYPDSGFDLTESNAASSFWVRSRNRLFKKMVLGYADQDRNTKFLEIGCGTGNFIQQLAQIDKLSITGSEVYLKGLLYAKRNIPDVEFVQFDVSQGCIGNDFDLIVAFDVLEHVEEDVAAIENMYGMLQNGGKIIITVPQHMFLWSALDEVVKHKRRYSRSELVEKLINCGFEITFKTSFLFVLFPLMLVSRLLDRVRDQAQSDEDALRRRVVFPTALNLLFDVLMRADEFLIELGLSLPFGGTLVVVAEKPTKS